jgi:CubicO group peptidase (beta-lactamase class C family)
MVAAGLAAVSLALLVAGDSGSSVYRITPLAPLPAQPAGVPWPGKAWPTGPIPPGAAAAVERALAATAASDPLLGETRAVVIVQGGRLLAERYRPGFGPDTPLISWSMAKSITQALVGIAVRQGLVDPDKPMGNPRWGPGDPRGQVTWRQWLNMVDGQEYHEIGVISPARNDAARMLYGEGRLDVAGFAARLPQVHPVGTHWNYNSAGINLVADALGRAFAPGAAPAARRARVAEVLRQELFGPLGMTSAEPEFDAGGTFVGSALVYATARDFARFGLLYLRDGVWEGRRILPEGWVDFARTKNPAPDCDVYGAGWWIAPAGGPGLPLPGVALDGARDLFLAQGHEGQIIAVVPSRDLVVVRLGLLDDSKGWPALQSWLKALLQAFPRGD